MDATRSKTKFRRPTALLLVAAIAVFSLAAAACTATSVETPAVSERPAGGGETTGAVSAIDPASGAAPFGRTQGISVANGGGVSGGFSGPESGVVSSYRAIEPYGAPVASYAVPSLYSGQANTANSGIWVTGQATLEIPADVAQVSIGVESREKTVAAARQKAAEAMDSVLAGIKESGVADDDVVTSYFNIQPQMIWVEVTNSLGRQSEPRITGYIVTNTVRVTVRDIDNLGPVVDTAATAGGDLVRINSIQFTVEDPSVFGAQVRENAAADALAKAELYARAMGVTLGPVVYLTELGGSVPMTKAYPAAFGESADFERGFSPTPISAGDVNLSASVQVVFAIIG